MEITTDNDIRLFGDAVLRREDFLDQRSDTYWYAYSMGVFLSSSDTGTHYHYSLIWRPEYRKEFTILVDVHILK